MWSLPRPAGRGSRRRRDHGPMEHSERRLRRGLLRAILRAGRTAARQRSWTGAATSAPRYGLTNTMMPPSSIMVPWNNSRLRDHHHEVEEATSFHITAKGVDDVEGNKPSRSRRNASNVFNMPNSTFIHSAVGNDNANTFSGDLDFSRVERRIDEEGGGDKEVLRELVAEMRDLLESGETLEKGRLAWFNDKLKEYPWLAGPDAGWLLNFGTQEIGQYLS